MNADEIKKIITSGEGLTVEFKRADNSLPKGIYETICAFLIGTEKPQLIEDTIFRIIIKCPEMGLNDGLLKNNLSKGVESGVESEMARMILKVLENKALSKSEIAESLGKKRPTRYLNDLIRRLLVNEIIEYTIPEKPASRLQKYRIKRNA